MGGRRPQCAKREPHLITVGECFPCRIWITARPPFLTASDHQPHAAATSIIDQFIAWYCTEPQNPACQAAPASVWTNLASASRTVPLLTPVSLMISAQDKP